MGRLVAWLSTVVPTLVLMLWAADYLLDCLKTVARPGNPLDLSLPTRSGAVRIRAETWSLDVAGRRLVAFRVALFSPSGDTIASADQVTAAAPAGGQGAYFVQLRGFTAGLERLHDGRWKNADLLPEASKEPGTTAFDVKVASGEVSVTDDSGVRAWTRTVGLTGVEVTGVGNRWLASGSANIRGVGMLSGMIRRRADQGLDFDAAGRGIEAAPLFAHFSGALEGRQVPFLGRCQAASLIIGGHVRGVLASGKLQITAEVDAQGTGLSCGEDLRSTSGTFKGTITESGLAGRLSLRSARENADALGTLTWNAGIKGLGDVDYALTDTTAAPKFLRSVLPKDLMFTTGRFKGRIAYGGNKAFQVDGDVTADTGLWGSERFDHPALRLLATPDRLALRVTRSRWLAGNLHGQVDVDLPSKKLTGVLATEAASIEQAARQWGRKELSGRTDARAVLGGTVASPRATIRASGTASVSMQGRRSAFLGNVELAAEYTAGKLRIERLAAAGPNGVFTAAGLWDVKGHRLSVDAFGSGVLLSAFQPDLEGTAVLQTHIVGKESSPKATGRFEVVGARLRDTTIPFVGGMFDWDGTRLQATGVSASKGATTANGEVSWLPKGGRLQGKFRAAGIQLSDWLKADVEGSLSVTSGTVQGTVDKPIVDMTIEGQALVAEGIRIDRLNSAARLAGRELTVRDLRLQADKGSFTARGSYDTASRHGDFTGSAKDLPLGRFLSASAVQRLLGSSPLRTVVDGTWSGDVEAKLDPKGLQSVAAQGNLNDVSMNGTRLGSGNWQADFGGTKWTGSLLVGELERFIEIPGIEYDSEMRTVRGELNAFHLTLHNVFSAVGPLLADASPEVGDRLDSLDGALDFGAKVDGPIDNLNVDIGTCEVSGLTLAQSPAGSLTLKAKRINHVWDVANLAWSAADGNLIAKGKIDEKGDISIDGELSDFRLGRLDVIDSDLARLSGRADVPFLVSGPIGSPVVTASLKAQSFGLAANPSQSSGPVEIDLNLTSILLQQGSLHAEGGFVYRGITGNVEADLPFAYPFSIPDDKPLHAEITLPKRPLSDFAQYADWIDFASTDGSIEGSVRMDGKTGALTQSGSLTVTASKVAFQTPKAKTAATKTAAEHSTALHTTLHDFKGVVLLQDRSVTVDCDARAGSAGVLSTHLQTTKLDPLDVLEGATQQLLASPVTGSVHITDFSVDEDIGNQGHVAFNSTGLLTISGQIRSPLLEGSLSFSGTSGTAPTAYGEPTPMQQPAVDPRFQIALSLADGSQMRSSTAEFLLHGKGSLTGSLVRPKAALDLRVEKGTIKLPNARIRVEPGGTMQFDYRVGQDGIGVPRLDIDLSGNTSVTALRYGDTLERYSIALRMTGDILDQGQMHISAQSNPPDLSEDRIMTILGQGELLEGLARGNESSLASYAIPAVLDPLTQKLASQLGLEYLSLEYDMFDRTMLSAARTLGKGLTVMARRQVSESTVGPLVYDVRLSYRLPFQNKALRSFSIGIGADQDRPWKLTLEFGKRF